MIPDITKHNPDPQYLRELLARAGLTQAAAAETLGLTARTMRSYLMADGGLTAPYPVQFCLEALARAGGGSNGR